MDLRLNQSSPLYREQVAEFASLHAPPEVLKRIKATGTIHDATIHKALATKSWIGRSWPLHPEDTVMRPAEVSALWEAMRYFDLPVDLLELTEMAAWVIHRVGTDPQRGRYLPAVRSGELLISLSYTEPDAGSDLASVRTAAESKGDGTWVIRGAKVFTTGAHVADLLLVLVRSDPDAPRHQGLTLFLVPRRSAGIEIQPIHTFGGERTNAVFYDNVVVPESAVLGGVNEGWRIVNLALDFERSLIGAHCGRVQRVFDDLVDRLAERRCLGEPLVRMTLAELNVRIEGAQALADQVHGRIALGLPFHVEAAMTKLAATEVFKDLTYAALDLVGPEGLYRDLSNDGTGGIEHWFRHSHVETIYGGSNEIQRNIIAGSRLGLPRG
jgi:alkylation response protein AidB-like acyl-CoA dehydrogenase